MAQISRSALVPYSAAQMYQLVNDVDAYPEFLPGCTGSRVLDNINDRPASNSSSTKYSWRARLLRAMVAEPGL
ncbi:hypothetical protein CRX72_25460 [Pantoea sp. BRM17]|nr:hypothetical protein CRX72_25460 [Pantoea sp. BRM17]